MLRPSISVSLSPLSLDIGTVLKFEESHICLANTERSISLSFNRVERLNHSSYVDSCCQLLSEAKEVETDSYLVAIVRLQCLAGKISDALSRRLPSDSYEILVNLLRGELQTFERTLTPQLRESCGSLGHGKHDLVYYIER